MSHNITVAGGTSVRLATAGKYCDRDIIVTAEGGSGGTDERFKQLVEGTITEVNDNTIENVKAYGFYGTKLTTVNLPNVTQISSYAFSTNLQLISVSLPSLVKGHKGVSYWQSVFELCYELKSVYLPLLESMGTNFFLGCRVLERLDLPSLKIIYGNSNFSSCNSLKAIILRSDTICTLANKNALSQCYHFEGTVNSTYNPEGKKDGYVYVPRKWLSDDDETMDYRRATNWTTFATQFRALEDYTVDGTTTGDLDWEKVNA